MMEIALVEPVEFSEKRLPTQEQVAERAKQIYLARGCAPDHEMDDWLQAEYELMQEAEGWSGVW